MKYLSPLPFPGKIRLLFAIFGIFFSGNRAGLQVKRVASKLDEYYFIHTIPSQLPVKIFGSNNLQFATIDRKRHLKKINPDFQIWLVFLVPFLNILRT